MAKKFLSLERLAEYDELIKEKIDTGDSSIKSYVDTEVAKKANSSHTHDDRYYTETEINSKLSTINASITNITGGTTVVKKAEYATSAGSADEAEHATSADSATSATKATQDGNGKVISSTYETKSDASSKLTEAKSYADSILVSAKSHTNEQISALLDGADDTTLDSIKELSDAIKENDTAIDTLNNIAAGKANATHSHAISDVSGLQSALDGKAAASHGTHVTFDSTNKPKMDGTAAFGTSTKVARADHVHPTDTSRASQTALDSHTSDTTKHITSTERTNWGAAYTHSQTAHAPSNAEKNQNAFSNVTVGTTTVSAGTTTDTLTLAGSNVTITPDTTNKKITIGVASGSTSAKGIVQLTNSTSSTSTTTAATPSSVKSAYDLANSAKTAAATAQSTADGKANKSHTHAISDITNLQTTLNNASSAISANTSSITVLQSAIEEITEISSEEIQSLFSAS